MTHVRTRRPRRGTTSPERSRSWWRKASSQATPRARRQSGSGARAAGVWRIATWSSRRSWRTWRPSANSSCTSRRSSVRGMHPRDQHFVLAGHLGRGGVQASRARGGLPLFQPCSAHEGRRSDRWCHDGALGGGRPDRAGHAHGSQAGARKGHTGIHSQSRRPRLRHRSAARPFARALPTSTRSTECCATAPDSAWGRSSCST